MSDSSVEVVVGSINLKRESGTLSCFVVNRPFTRDSVFSVASQGQRRFTQSTHHERGGRFCNASLPFEDGTVLMIQGRRTQNGMIYADGVTFFRVRASGPMTNLFFKPPHGVESLLGARMSAFLGRGDILSLEQLDALGFRIPARFVDNYMNEEEVEELFDFQELVQGSTPVPEFSTVATSKGELKVVAMAKEAPRRLRVRGRG